MADPLSVAASAAGLVSLGLQVCSGITQYLDALKCREQELDSARRYLQSLHASLQIIKDAAQQSQLRPLQPLAACLQPCQDELKAMGALIVKLSNGGIANPTLIDRAKEQKKKMAYALNRSKLLELEDRLNRAVGVVQLAVQGLGINISVSASDRLRTIEAASTSSATEVLAVRPRLIAVENSVSNMRSELPVILSNVQNIAPEMALKMEYISNQVVSGNQILEDKIIRAEGATAAGIAMLQCQLNVVQSMMQNMQELLPTDNYLTTESQLPRYGSVQEQQRQEIQSKRALGHAISKPSELRRLCDEFKGDQAALQPWRTEFLGACSCRPRHRSRRKQIVWGPLQLYHDAAQLESHLPNCPLYQSTQITTKSWGISYNKVKWILDKAVQISFSMTSGAGGSSISPMFTYYATVDERHAPAFQVIDLMMEFAISTPRTDTEPGSLLYRRLLREGLIKLQKLYLERKASPSDLNSQNQNLMHWVAELICLINLFGENKQEAKDLSLEFLGKIQSYGIPTNQYDTSGETPVWSLIGSYPTWSPKALEAMFPAGTDVPQAFSQLTSDSCPYMVMVQFLHLQKLSPLFSEAHDCGPLSEAVAANDLGQTEMLLKTSPSMAKEKNIHGQIPLHFAVENPRCLQLVLSSDRNVLNEPDNNNHAAIHYALYFSLENCRSSYRIHCRRCNCAEPTVMLLKADCAVWVLPDLYAQLRDCSQRCKKRFIKGLRNRRDRLEQLAMESLPNYEMGAMELGSGCVLDIHAASVVELLVGRGIKIPAALSICAPLDTRAIRKSWGSVYHAITSVNDAELFLRQGFHDVDGLNGQGLPPLVELRHGFTYILWLVQHGADLFRQLDPIPAYDGRLLPPATTAHYVYRNIGHCFLLNSSYKNPNLLDPLHTLNSMVFSINPLDTCQCKCSQQGCTPFLLMIKELTCRRGTRSTVIVDNFLELLPCLYGDLQPLHWREAIRYFTFTALDLTHTCFHRPEERGYNYEKRDKETIDDSYFVQEEQDDMIELLERLVCEFYEKIEDLSGVNGIGLDEIIDFWEDYWSRRMEEEIQAFSGSNVPEEQRRGAEELGVVWNDLDSGSESEPEDEYLLGSYLRRLNEIVPD